MENKRKQKKKLSITQFFIIYIAILALILVGISACNSSLNSGNTQKLESSSPDSSGPATTDTGSSEPAPSPTADPNLPLSGLTIVIDAGHQETPPEGKETIAPWSTTEKAKNTHGTTGVATGNNEYEINLEIALKIRDTLQAQGANVVMTRDNNGTSLSNQDRANVANTSNAQLAISIHCNGAESASANGTEIYLRGDGDGTTEYKNRSIAEKALATSLLNSVCESTGSKNRGAKTSDSYTGINYSNIPFFILECGFMSNETEDRKLGDAAYQQKIADGILKFLESNKASLLS